MARDLASTYDREFFTRYGACNREYAEACRFIADEIFRRFRPHTAVDWGCGAGLHAAALASHGVAVVGIDGVVVDAELRGEVEVRRADLTRPVAANLIPGSYDLSLCIDVMEHLHDEESASALANITRGAKLVILSCAPPGQGGHHHVNERPRRYWIARMAQIGWRYDRTETGAMEQFFLANRGDVPLSWMYHNLCVYRPTDVER